MQKQLDRKVKVDDTMVIKIVTDFLEDEQSKSSTYLLPISG